MTFFTLIRPHFILLIFLGGCTASTAPEFKLVNVDRSQCKIITDGGTPAVVISSSGSRATYGTGPDCPRYLPGSDGKIAIWKRQSIVPEGSVVRMVTFEGKDGKQYRSTLRRSTSWKAHKGRFTTNSVLISDASTPRKQ